MKEYYNVDVISIENKDINGVPSRLPMNALRQKFYQDAKKYSRESELWTEAGRRAILDRTKDENRFAYRIQESLQQIALECVAGSAKIQPITLGVWAMVVRDWATAWVLFSDIRRAPEYQSSGRLAEWFASIAAIYGLWAGPPEYAAKLARVAFPESFPLGDAERDPSAIRNVMLGVEAKLRPRYPMPSYVLDEIEMIRTGSFMNQG